MASAPDARPRVFMLIPTHTARHLDACVASIARQTSPPDGVVVTCDSDDPAIGGVLDAVWPKVAEAIQTRGGEAPTLVHTWRAPQGEPRLNQVRNNGLRALDLAFDLARERGGPDQVLVVDGDTILEPGAVARHRALVEGGAEVVLAYRINLDESRTARISVGGLLAGDEGLEAGLVTGEDLAELARRQHRLARQLWMRRHLPAWFPGRKPHKPKLLGGHHAVSAGVLAGVNGYDEYFRGDGTDDDDLARRMYMLEPPVRVETAAADILAFHLYHPTRRPWRPTEAPNYARFSRTDAPVSAERGWTSPRPQHISRVRVIGRGARGTSAGLGAWAHELEQEALAALAGTPFCDRGVDRSEFVASFADERGHRRTVDRPLIALMLGVDAGPSLAGASPDAALWWALHDPGVDPRGLIDVSGEGELLGSRRRGGVEIDTESEMAALHALWHHAERRRDGALRERCMGAARRLVREIQPDNATGHPWGVHVFVTLSEVLGDSTAGLYAQTLVHNARVGRGTPDRFSACLLLDAAMALEREGVRAGRARSLGSSGPNA